MRIRFLNFPQRKNIVFSTRLDQAIYVLDLSICCENIHRILAF